jgi:tRNA-uridine 2-sulfurtransferase
VGLSFYTLGQRKGIGIGGQKESSGEPWFVARKDLTANALYVVQGHGHPWLLSKQLDADSITWVAGASPKSETGQASLAAKTRYRQLDSTCTLAEVSEVAFSLQFDEPQWAVTPGQSAVLYQGEVCLGGGLIASAARI